MGIATFKFLSIVAHGRSSTKASWMNEWMNRRHIRIYLTDIIRIVKQKEFQCYALSSSSFFHDIWTLYTILLFYYFIKFLSASSYHDYWNSWLKKCTDKVDFCQLYAVLISECLTPYKIIKQCQMLGDELGSHFPIYLHSLVTMIHVQIYPTIVFLPKITFTLRFYSN